MKLKNFLFFSLLNCSSIFLIGSKATITWERTLTEEEQQAYQKIHPEISSSDLEKLRMPESVTTFSSDLIDIDDSRYAENEKRKTKWSDRSKKLQINEAIKNAWKQEAASKIQKTWRSKKIKQKLTDEEQMDLNKKLHTAIKKNNLIEASLAIRSGADVNESIFIDSNSHNIPTIHYPPLFFVSSPEMTLLLLKNKANPNILNIYGATPLHHIQDPEILNLLVKGGARVTIPDNQNSEPIHYSFMNPNKLSFLIKAQADVNATNNKGETLLMIMCNHPYKDDLIEKFIPPIKILLQHRATIPAAYKNDPLIERAQTELTEEKIRNIKIAKYLDTQRMIDWGATGIVKEYLGS